MSHLDDLPSLWQCQFRSMAVLQYRDISPRRKSNGGRWSNAGSRQRCAAVDGQKLSMRRLTAAKAASLWSVETVDLIAIAKRALEVSGG